MAISANNPRLSNQIKSDVPEIQQKETALLKMDPTNVADLEVGAKRLTEISSGNWQFQMWNGSQWVNVGKLKMDVDTVDGYDASITPKANTVAVRGSNGKLQDSITGNAATADSAVTISTTLEVGKGGTGATSSEQARRNLDVPPTSHASANTTYGISSESVYGHAKASSDAPAQDTDAGAIGIKVSEFARGDHSHKKVLGNASTYGQVKLTDSVSDGSAASSSVAASAKAVKTAYDKAVNAYDEANKAATTIMTGATSTSAGVSGNVPAPAAGRQEYILQGNGEWTNILKLVKLVGAVLAKENSDKEGGQIEFESPKGDNVILDMFYDTETSARMLRVFSASVLKHIIKFNIDSGAVESPSIITDSVFGNSDKLQLLASRILGSSAILSLFSTADPNNPGAFAVSATNGTARKYLVGTPTGGLSWDGGSVPVVSTTAEKGRIETIGVIGNAYLLPAGGSWMYFVIATNATGEIRNQLSGIQAGGTNIVIAEASILRGFAWRVM